MEFLQAPNNINQQPTLFNHAIQYLRIKAIKGDVEAKVKLGIVLSGQLRTTDEHWQTIIDKREAELWGQSLFDRWLSSAIVPCLGLVETNLLHCQKGSDKPTTFFRLMDTILSYADDTLNDSDQQKSKTINKIKGDMSYLVGLMRLKGIGLEKDIQQATTYFQRASQQDHDGAIYQLAMMMEDQYTYPDLYDMKQSVTLYEKMVMNHQKKKKNGSVVLSGPDARALTKLARVYYEGEGQAKDLEKAYQYARKVAEGNGEKYCQFMVGDILLQQKDIQQSLFWLAQSGQQGFPLAIEALARIYFEGIPSLVKQDYDLAHEWCLKGDDIWPSGLGYCQSCLGDMYRQGLGVPKDQMKSFEYYQKAASQQDAPQNYARYMLGEM
ncbi:uncharacterized protein BX664DRAFT_259697 [Halteromyces radiatus]|uniref:uncharacterized protein n=1 Tax=Halteromyces radiatus TaxID=101107 RepID=UPI0022200BA8|nr:uncharacterized protein BX664DRAFT_259697 [Halteromyces radiatus]KAI8093631.1 hypothetical protein BX664DRAFT_259697 [Halteromyces radiatus]